MSEEATLDEFAESSDTGDSQERQETPIGELPADWGVEWLNDIVEINPDGFSEDEWPSETFEYISLSEASDGEIADSQTTPLEDAPSRAQRTVQQGDVLVGTVRPKQRSHGFVSEEHDGKICSSGFGVLRPGTRLNSRYLLQEILSNRFFSQMEAYVAGSGYPAVKISDLKKHRVANPPLSEQRKIATILYTVDQAIEKTSGLIEQLGRVKQGVRQNILTSGITEEDEVRASPETEPEQYTDARQWTVPNSWELKELSDICSIQVGYAFKSDWYQEEGNVRVLRGANVGYGEPDWSETYFLEPERVSEYEDYLLDEGDLIIGMDRPYTNSGFKISRLSEIDVPSLLVQRVGRFVPEGCDPDYLHVVLSDWRYQKQVLRRAQGMDIPHISQTDILSPKIPLPPLDEQKRIADRYSSILERMDCEENLLREYKTLKQGLMQDLLSGTVRTTDTNIEVPEEVAQYG